ncbi:hypothetical protein VTO42DRAFT_4811 [Malbranchea cinnamomea]
MERTPEQQANFDERVRRGAAAFEGLFDESKPCYKYVTKTDFVPLEQRQPPRQSTSSDLPLRTETDRSSVMSTLIDINLGDFESAHYAAGSASQDPPFQLADVDTIRANRSSNRSLRNSSSGGSEQGFDFHTLQQRGPRPPTMEWTFPSMTTAVEGDDARAGPDEEEGYGDTDLPYDGNFHKRDTRTWTFPVMTTEEGTGAADSEGEGRGLTDDAAEMQLPPAFLQPAPLSRNCHAQARETAAYTSAAETTESRPSTSRSGQSAASDADYDPFKLDRQTPTGEMDKFPSLVDAEEYTENSSVYPREAERTTDSASEADQAPMRFPDLVPPSMDSLMEGAPPEVMMAEMDRLLGDLVTGLSVMGRAFAQWEEDEEE